MYDEMGGENKGATKKRLAFKKKHGENENLRKLSTGFFNRKMLHWIANNPNAIPQQEDTPCFWPSKKGSNIVRENLTIVSIEPMAFTEMP